MASSTADKKYRDGFGLAWLQEIRNIDLPQTTITNQSFFIPYSAFKFGEQPNNLKRSIKVGVNFELQNKLVANLAPISTIFTY